MVSAPAPAPAPASAGLPPALEISSTTDAPGGPAAGSPTGSLEDPISPSWERSIDLQAIRSSKRADVDLVAPRWPWRRPTLSKKVRHFYRAQNDMIDELVGDASETQEMLPGIFSRMETRMSGADSPTPEGRPTREAGESNDGAWQVRWAVNGSLALNVILLCAKVLAVVLSGSMSVIASAADSLLDLVSGAVLAVTQRATCAAMPPSPTCVHETSSVCSCSAGAKLSPSSVMKRHAVSRTLRSEGR